MKTHEQQIQEQPKDWMIDKQTQSYNPQYEKKVYSIAEDEEKLNKLIQSSDGYVKDKEDFLKKAFDNKVGWVHSQIKLDDENNYQMPKHIIKYTSESLGTQRVTLPEYLELNKDEYDSILKQTEGDQDKAYQMLLKSKGGIIDGRYDDAYKSAYLRMKEMRKDTNPFKPRR